DMTTGAKLPVPRVPPRELPGGDRHRRGGGNREGRVDIIDRGLGIARWSNRVPGVEVWDLRSPKPLLRTYPDDPALEGPVVASADGRSLAAVCSRMWSRTPAVSDGGLALCGWDLESGGSTMDYVSGAAPIVDLMRSADRSALVTTTSVDS